jgi:hypothetical protein
MNLKTNKIMTLEHFKRIEDGIVIWRSICKYESNGIKKQINVEAHSTFHGDFFERIINEKK